MTRRGRKRKQGRRTSSGALARTPLPDPREPVGEQPHRGWLPKEMRLSEKAVDLLGCLNLKGIITDEQHEAGRRYAVVAGGYRAIISGPGALAGGSRGRDCNPEHCAVELCACRATTERYLSALFALSDSGEDCKRAVENVALHGQPPRFMAELRFGLDALAQHFGLTGAAKKPKHEIQTHNLRL